MGLRTTTHNAASSVWPLAALIACGAPAEIDAAPDTEVVSDSEVVPEDTRERVVADGTLPADTCAQARALEPIRQLQVTVRAEDYRDDLRASPCLPFGSPGPDLVFPVRAPAGALVQVAGQSTWDAQVYLLDDCDVPASCLAGSDRVYASEVEFLGWVNDGPARTIYAVIDLFDPHPAPGDIDVQMQVEVE